MTLKNLFFKLQKEDLKRRIWTIALSVLVFFICLPIYCALSIENYNANYAGNLDKKQIFNEILNFMGPQNELIIVMTIISAIVCGLSGFFYLHSRKKVDFYHSMPVRREILFSIRYLNGLLIYSIPYFVNVILCFIILQVNHYMNIEIFTTTISAIANNFLFYSLIYTIVIIAVILTGNIVISFMGTAVFLLYGILIMGVKDMYFTEFFTNYYSRESKILEWISPIVMYINVASQISFSNNYRILGKILGVLIVTLLLIGFSIFLYKKRPSEAATKAMAFKYSRPIIKFFLVIPVSLMGGIIFKQMSNGGSNGWLIFGLIFTLIISYAIIEIIYNFDIRSAFHSKKQLLICAGVIAVTVCIFQFDLFQYDSYIPTKNKIESMSVAISGLDENNQYYQQVVNNDFYNGNNYIDGVSYQLKYMELKNFDSAYNLAKIGVAEQPNKYQVNDGNEIYYTYYVKYTLNSGREVYRTYRLLIGENYELLKDIYESAEFKKIHYPIYKIKVEDIDGIYCNNMFDSKEISLDNDEKNQLLDIYTEELSNMTLDVASNNYPIASFTIQINDYYSLENSLYPTFEKTISFLKEHGFDATKKLEVKDIKRIIVNNQLDSNDQSIYNNYNKYIKYTKDTAYAPISAEYTNSEEIEAILPNLIQSDYYWNNRTIYNMNTDIEVYIIFKMDEYGNEGNGYFYFKTGTIPDFVLEDIQYNQE